MSDAYMHIPTHTSTILSVQHMVTECTFVDEHVYAYVDRQVYTHVVAHVYTLVFTHDCTCDFMRVGTWHVHVLLSLLMYAHMPIHMSVHV